MQRIIVIDESNVKALARELAALIQNSPQEEQYYPPSQLSELIPAMSKTKIASQIRDGKYGKKFGEKGRLLAKVSEVTKHNRI